jgi:uncharacterized protein YukJ
MNQGSDSQRFWHKPGNDHNDHNDTWQDGGVMVDFGADGWAAYFTAFTQQMVPTDNLGNPAANKHGMTDDDNGSLIGS